jgi:predicted branched-subunit amino acid permease
MPHRIEFAALVDVAPILVGLVPFAGVVGITMAGLDIPVSVALLGSALLYSGSAQLALLGLLGTGAGIVPMLASVVLINSRFAMYGGALEPMFRNQPRWFRWFGPLFVIDQNYGLANARSDLADATCFRRYWLTTSIAIAVVWLGTIAGAMTFGGAIPAGSPLYFASVGIYVALLVPGLKDRAGIVAAGVSAVTALSLSGLSSGVGVLAGVIAGISIAALIKGKES